LHGLEVSPNDYDAVRRAIDTAEKTQTVSQ
jgi:hypothetical protein